MFMTVMHAVFYFQWYYPYKVKYFNFRFSHTRAK
jgi:hypothetical protein